MTSRPKLATVAEAAGVSTATASQVMRGAGRISESTRKKVLAAARKLHYVPDGRAASMRSGENREIGMVIHQISNPFNAEVISGVSDRLEEDGYLVSVLDARDSEERQRRSLEAFIRNSRGGLLWVPAEDTSGETYALLATHRIPTVTFLRRANDPLLDHVFDHVGIENAAATATATHHLAQLGHTRIAFLGGVATSDVRMERIAGYQSAMEELGLGEPVVWKSEDDKLAGMNAMTALHVAHPDVTGIVSNGDMVALGASLAIQRLGLVPGKHISVVGFDDVKDAAVATPPLTTMAVSPYELGGRLASVLLERIRNPDMLTTTSLVAARLVERETTGAVTSARK